MDELKLNVDGMHCRSCEMLVADELGELEGVRKVEANHKDGVVRIQYEGRIDVDWIRKKIQELGYRVRQ